MEARRRRHIVWVRSVLAAQLCQASALATVQAGVYAFVSPGVFESPGTYAACITTGAVVLCLLSIVIGKSSSLPSPWNTAAGVLWTTAWAVLLLGLSVYMGMHTFVVVTVSLSTAVGLVAALVYILTIHATPPPPPPPISSSSPPSSRRQRSGGASQFVSHLPVRVPPTRRVMDGGGDSSSDSDSDDETAALVSSSSLQNIVTPFQVKVLFIVLGLVVVLCVALFHADIQVSAHDTVVWVCVWSLTVTGVFVDAWFMIRTPVDSGVYVDAVTPSLLVHAHVMRVAACYHRHNNRAQ